MTTARLLALCAVAASLALNYKTIDTFYKFTDESRNEYFSQAAIILHDNDVIGSGKQDPRLRKVDTLLYEYVEIAARARPALCVPFVSQYSDCSMHNICTGCTVCHCDLQSRWNCSQLQTCRPPPNLLVDHRILAMAMENLLEDEQPLLSRRKRSVNRHEDISKWFYGLNPFDLEHENTSWSDNNELPSAWNSKSDHLSFEQFLIDILRGLHYHDVEQVKNTKGDENNENIFNNSKYIEFVNMLENADMVTESSATETRTNKQMDYDNVTQEETLDRPEVSEENKRNENMNEINILHNLRKRELLVNTSDIHTNKSIAVFIKNITESTFQPLDSIIKMKESEINELKHVRDNLLGSINAYVGIQPATSNDTFNTSDVHFVVYKLDYSNVSLSQRRDNKNVLQTYQIKLERDIQKVIKDIAVIQRIIKSSNISLEYRYLFRALRHFIKRKIKSQNVNNLSPSYIRRSYTKSEMLKPKRFNPLLLISNILEFLDKDMPQVNILPLLPQSSMKITKRIIQQLHTDELVYVNLKIRDENMIKDLNEIGNKWENKMVDILNSTHSEKLVKLKAFHLELSKGIDTIKDTLTLIGFAQRRRMSMVNDLRSERAVMEHLANIHRDIDRITEMAKRPVLISRRSRQKVKHGFLEKVKKLLKKSKKDIRRILKKKTPTEMIKRIAKTRLDEMTKNKLLRYENAMREWRAQLGANRRRRRKRSPNEFNKFIDRVKHIFPRYPRRKAKRMKNVESKKNNTKKQNKTQKGGLRNARRKHLISSTVRPRRSQRLAAGASKHIQTHTNNKTQ